MHILFILDYFHPYIWWIETLFDDVTSYWKDQWYQITVVTSHHDPKLQKIEKRNGITIYRVWKSRWNIIPTAIWFGIKKRSLLQWIDHIHTSTFAAALSGRILAKLYRKPCTITIHEIYHNLRKHLKKRAARIYKTYEYLICRLQWNRIITVSDYTRSMIQNIHHVPDHRICTIYNQIDKNFWSIKSTKTDQMKQLKEKYNLTGCVIGLFIGRLGYEKWLPYLIESLDYITKNHKNFRLIIVSPKTKKKYPPHIQEQIKQTEKQIKDNYLTKHIIRIDPVENDEILKEYMAIADIGIIPSMSEWFCYTAVQMEAMWLPLIVSNVWALPEVLSAQHTFIEYWDIPALSNALESAIKKDKEKNKIKTKLNHWTINFQEYYDIFESCKKQ